MLRRWFLKSSIRLVSKEVPWRSKETHTSTNERENWENQLVEQTRRRDREKNFVRSQKGLLLKKGSFAKDKAALYGGLRDVDESK